MTRPEPRAWASRSKGEPPILALFATLAAIVPVHHDPGCNTRACDRRVNAAWVRKHRPRVRPWAIPAYIVMCESKGTNERPNSAGAAGYYQIIPSTWAANGGSPPNDASRHTRAEQDRVARRIWQTSGPGAWVCA